MTTPLNCAECGTRAEPGQAFCDACGAVLGWTARPDAGDGTREARGAADGAGRGSGDGSDEASPDSYAASPDSAAGTVTAAAGGSGGIRPGAFTGAGGNPESARTHRVVRSDRATVVTDPPVSEPASAPWPREATRPDNPVSDASARTPVPEPGSSHHPTLPADDAKIPTQPISTPSATPMPTTSEPGAASDGVTNRARQLLVPVADPEPSPSGWPSVAPVLPGRPAPQRLQDVRAPGEELGANGGAPCPWCSTRNRPNRHFCTRCAMPMAGEGETRTPGRLPWWRRLFGAGNRGTPWAGQRPHLRRAFDRVVSWLGAGVVLTLLFFVGFNIPRGIQATKDHFSKRASVEPDSWSASRSYPGHKPELVGDKLNNTWWGPGVSESGEGQWLQAKFDVPTRLLDLIITPGVSTRPDQISQSARPHRLKATITLSDGRTVTREISLDPGAGGQRIPFRAGTVSSVSFTIESATGTSSTKQVAIAEIEFFGPSSADSA